MGFLMSFIKLRISRLRVKFVFQCPKNALTVNMDQSDGATHYLPQWREAVVNPASLKINSTSVALKISR